MNIKTKRMAIYVAILLVFIMIGSAVGIIAGTLKSVPRLEDVRFNPKMTTTLYDVHDEVVARIFKENRLPVSLEEIPKTFQAAVISIEDQKFYEHHGLNFMAILRALITDILHGEVVQGGSTITQQLAKIAFLTNEQTFVRKIKDAVWAIQIERKYTKDEILETYLNEIYLGHGAYGVEAASQLYFGKSVKRLNLPESALLAGIIRGPEYYSPYVNMEAARRRRNTVLNVMADLGYITRDQAESAKKAPITVVGLKQNRAHAPYFVDYVLQQLLDKYGEAQVYSGGLKIYTSLDLKMQLAAEKALLDLLPNGKIDENKLQQPQGALIAIDPHSGYIKAMVGGRGEDKFNRAVQAVRQPGSAMKPFVYMAAIDRGYTTAQVIDDSPVEYSMPDGSIWAPQNVDNKFRGPITLRTALEQSVNIVAIKLLDQIGAGTAIEYAKKMGITTLVEKGTLNDRNLSLALGGITRGVTPMEMTTAYGVLANQGILVEPVSIVRVEDRDGNVLEENRAKKQIVLNEQTSYIITDMLKGVITRGTGQNAAIGRPAAGKTGTTSDYTDAWFVGYTPDLVASVWMGNDNPKEKLVFGDVKFASWRSAQIWAAFMSQALVDTPVRDFPVPEGIVTADIDADTGLLATAECTNVRTEVFISGTEPTQYCNVHEHDAGLGGNPPGNPPQNPSNPATGPNGTSPNTTGPNNQSTPPGNTLNNNLRNDTGSATSPALVRAPQTPAQPSSSNAAQPPVANLIKLEICTDHGLLATDACPRSQVVTRWYKRDTGQEVNSAGAVVPGSFAPTYYCDVHKKP
ncbi:MAG: PBP1A family penicillin-binding protein [Firmicutes bacterium]|nr:PBP1A family penicillin-binding protein [Bacillota bacterium]